LRRPSRPLCWRRPDERPSGGGSRPPSALSARPRERAPARARARAWRVLVRVFSPCIGTAPAPQRSTVVFGLVGEEGIQGREGEGRGEPGSQQQNGSRYRSPYAADAAARARTAPFGPRGPWYWQRRRSTEARGGQGDRRGARARAGAGGRERERELAPPSLLSPLATNSRYAPTSSRASGRCPGGSPRGAPPGACRPVGPGRGGIGRGACGERKWRRVSEQERGRGVSG